MAQHVRLPDDTSLQPTGRCWQGCPWEAIDDDPGLGFVYEARFVGWDNDLWAVVNATSGTMTAEGVHGGAALVSAAAATDGQGVRAANPGAAGIVTPSASRTIWLGAVLRQTLQTSTLNATWFGLATHGAALGTDGAPDATDRIGFVSENAADVKFHYLDAGATEYEADTGTDFVSAEDIKLEMRIEGLDKVVYYINGVETSVSATSAKSIPDGLMNIAVANVANGGTGTPTTRYYWIRMACLDDTSGTID